MGLISETVMVKWYGTNKKYYINKGYPFTKMGDEFEVNVEDLSNSFGGSFNVKCDNCNKELHIPWINYKKCVKEDKKYYCKGCASKLYGIPKRIKKQLKNSKSFYQWCIENNRQDVLDRWNYKLNNCSPMNVTYSSGKKYWLNCPVGVHNAEEKKIDNFIKNIEGCIECKACNSFAQWGIDNLGEDFLEKYWSDKNKISPWDISYSVDKKVYIICQKKEYHKDYYIGCNKFIQGARCHYCNSKGSKIHYLDSLGQYIVDNFGENFLNKIWSNKNKKSAFEYLFKSTQKVYWKCPDEKHEDYLRSIKNSNKYNFRCSECNNYSKGEEKISQYFINNNINYTPQKTFDGLIGLGGGNLSYDFYLLNYNLLVEYDGEYHYIPIRNYKNEPIEYAEERLRKQQEHDRLKDEYAKNNNIKLLRILYWDFDDIEEILERELNKAS